LLLSLLAFAALVMLAGPFIRFFYSNEFTPVIPLIYFSGFGMLLYGLGSFFNRFLEAHGAGKMVRNTHMVMGVSLLLLNLLLIPPYGPAGAAVAMVVANMVYLAGMWAGYVRRGFSLRY
jgi:O-antigen/teichoic acid export membrane protein